MQNATEQALIQVFASAAKARSTILDKKYAPNDLERLYDRATGKLAIPDHHVPLIGDRLTTPRPVRLTPNIWAFRSLFRCFAGVVADMPLPKGAFFSGSAVLAAATIPCVLATPTIVNILTQRGQEHERRQHVAFMSVNRCLGGNRPGISAKVVEFYGGADKKQIENLREEITSAMPITLDGHDTSSDDVLFWTHNGFGFYAKADIDIFLAVKTPEEGDVIVRQIYKTLAHVEEGDVCNVRTPNTLTFARSYPERHCQCVLLFADRVHHHLAFADLCCTATALVDGIPFTSARSRAALSTKVNLCPTSMLAIRRDTPRRVAKSIKRGFIPIFLEDRRAGDTAMLMEWIGDELAYKGKRLLPLLLIAESDDDIDLVDMDATCKYLLSHNTCYNAFNIPRMIDLTAECIELFFKKLAERAAIRGDDEHLVSALVYSVEQIPKCAHKLEKSKKEVWVSYGMLQK